LTHNLTARLSRSVAVVDYLDPHFDNVHNILLDTVATAIYIVGHYRLFTVRCVLLDAVYAVRCILLDILATVIYFVEHTGSCEYILLDTLATVMNLSDTGDCSLSGCILLDTAF